MALHDEINREINLGKIPVRFTPQDLKNNPDPNDEEKYVIGKRSYKRSTIDTALWNQSITKDGTEMGNPVKKGTPPNYYRLENGFFETISSPKTKIGKNPSLLSSKEKIKGTTQMKDLQKQSKLMDFTTLSQRMIDALPKIKVGLGKYNMITQRFNDTTDVSTDREFKRGFNHFYRIQKQKPAFYDAFYKLLQDLKTNNKNREFSYVLDSLYKSSNKLQASFGSKLLATVDHNKPVWDIHVLNNLGLKKPIANLPVETRKKRIIELYSQIQEWYKTAEKNNEMAKYIEAFDSMYPDSKDKLSKVKKIDLGLWQAHD